MKQKIILFSVLVFSLVSCKGNDKKNSEQAKENEQTAVLSREEIAARPFEELFREITPQELEENVFTLVAKENSVITVGTPPDYNSMVASFGGWGQLFSKPVTWFFPRSSRYTLEMIRKEKTYTMSYFDEAYRSDFMLFGRKSGRNSDKMKETQLTSVQTPLGNTGYKEARLIIECQLTEITTVSPADFYNDEGLKFIEDAYEETGDYHKIVFGTITKVWVRK